VILVLAERRDAGARAVHDALTRRLGADRVGRVLPTDLVRARWSHGVSATGVVASAVRLREGRELAPTAVLHRLVGVPAPSPAGRGRDADYIASEFNALVASWLLSLGHRVLGPTGAYATATGPSPLAALAHAEDCGLPVSRRGLVTRGGLVGAAQSGERHLTRIAWPGGIGAPVPADVVSDRPVTSRLLVVAERVHGPLADRFAGAASRLAAALDTNLLELSFADGPCLVDVSTMPRLTNAGDVQAVTHALVDLEMMGGEHA
jgi:hypothetical protein